MRPQSQGFVWHKTATREWVAAHDIALQTATDGDYAVIEAPGRARVQVEAFCVNRAHAQNLQARFGGSVRKLPRDWETRFFANARTKPLRIGSRLIVASDAADAGSGPSLIIPAAAAFGTGEHATTAMSLRMLERISRRLLPGWRMLDAGTGSGILALAGACFGAGHVLAIDNDPRAISTARENAERNGIAGVKFVAGDARRKIRGTFDVITANLYSELLIELLGTFRKSLRAGGHIILSGVLREQEPELATALKRHRIRALETRRRGKWIALLCSGSHRPPLQEQNRS